MMIGVSEAKAAKPARPPGSPRSDRGEPAHDILHHRGHPLGFFFAPANVAVIGASEAPNSVGRSLLWNLVSHPFGGTVFPVNAKRPSVLGIKAYPRIADVPHDQFEEWLVFAAPTEIQSWEALVNYSGISLTNPICDSLHERLWSQIESVRPESYLADGDRLIFITRSQELHKLALAHEDL